MIFRFSHSLCDGIRAMNLIPYILSDDCPNSIDIKVNEKSESKTQIFIKYVKFFTLLIIGHYLFLKRCVIRVYKTYLLRESLDEKLVSSEPFFKFKPNDMLL